MAPLKNMRKDVRYNLVVYLALLNGLIGRVGGFKMFMGIFFENSSDKLIENCLGNKLNTSRNPEALPEKPKIANKPVRIQALVVQKL